MKKSTNGGGGALALKIIPIAISVCALVFSVVSFCRSRQYTKPNIQIQWHPKSAINTSTSPLVTYYEQGYYVIPVRIRNKSFQEATLEDISLVVGNISVYDGDAATFGLYEYAWNSGDSTTATLERELFLTQLQTPVRVASLDVVDGYFVFDAFDISANDLDAATVTIAYKTSYSDKLIISDIIPDFYK